MSDIESLQNINIAQWLFEALVIIAAIVAIITLIGKLVEIMKKPAEFVNGQKADHTQLESFHSDYEDFKAKMQEYGKKYNELKSDMDKSESYYKEIVEKIDDFTTATQKNLEAITEYDRQQDEQTKYIKAGVMELLGDKIDQRFLRYTQEGGIPEAEVDEFEKIYKAYEKLGGNGGRKLKHDQIKRMPIRLNGED